MVDHNACVWCEGWYNQSNSHFRMVYVRFTDVLALPEGTVLKHMDNIHDGCLYSAKKGEVRPQDRPPMPRIIDVVFEGDRGRKIAFVTLDDATRVRVFSWYTDELTFTESELIGLTVYEAEELHRKRDVAYLQS